MRGLLVELRELYAGFLGVVMQGFLLNPETSKVGVFQTEHDHARWLARVSGVYARALMLELGDWKAPRGVRE